MCGGPGMLVRSIHASAPFGPIMAVKVCGPAQLPAAGVSSSSACSKHLKLSARRPARRTSGCAAGRQLLLPPSPLPPAAMAEPCQQLSSIHSSSSSCKGTTQPITADGKIPTGRPEQFYRTEWSHIVQARGARNEMSSPTCSATPASTATPDHPQRLCTPPNTHTRSNGTMYGSRGLLNPTGRSALALNSVDLGALGKESEAGHKGSCNANCNH